MRISEAGQAGDEERVITPEGYDRLAARLRSLIETRQSAIADRLRDVRAAESDLSESVEYRAVLDQAEDLEREIDELRSRLAEVRVLRPWRGHGGGVQIGSTVTLAFGDERLRVQIVGTEDADPLAGRISTRSPLGRALIGHAAGDTVRWSAPEGEIAARVVRVA